MDGRSFVPVGVIIAIAIIIVMMTMIGMNREDDAGDVVANTSKIVIARDPLDAELARCSGLGEAGIRDLSCLKAWAENRRRFLDQRKAPGKWPMFATPDRPVDENGPLSKQTPPVSEPEPFQPEIR